MDLQDHERKLALGGTTLWDGDYESIKDLKCPDCNKGLHASYFGGLICTDCWTVIDPDTKAKMICPTCAGVMRACTGMYYPHNCGKSCRTPPRQVICKTRLCGGPDGIEDTDFPNFFVGMPCDKPVIIPAVPRKELP